MAMYFTRTDFRLAVLNIFGIIGVASAAVAILRATEYTLKLIFELLEFWFFNIVWKFDQALGFSITRLSNEYLGFEVPLPLAALYATFGIGMYRACVQSLEDYRDTFPFERGASEAGFIHWTMRIFWFFACVYGWPIMLLFMAKERRLATEFDIENKTWGRSDPSGLYHLKCRVRITYPGL